MPLTKEHKQQSREKMLSSAIELFSRRGYDNVSIDDVTMQAGLTRGAFYAHFKSKSDLYAQAIRQASKNNAITQEHFKGAQGKAFIRKIIDGYLSSEHVTGAISPCPLAFLATDVANKDDTIRSVYTEVFRNLSALMKAESELPTKGDQRDVMLATSAMMIGGVVIARALTDTRLADQLLKSCRTVAHQLTN